jgi:hypothetical protein
MLNLDPLASESLRAQSQMPCARAVRRRICDARTMAKGRRSHRRDTLARGADDALTIACCETGRERPLVARSDPISLLKTEIQVIALLDRVAARSMRARAASPAYSSDRHRDTLEHSRVADLTILVSLEVARNVFRRTVGAWEDPITLRLQSPALRTALPTIFRGFLILRLDLFRDAISSRLHLSRCKAQPESSEREARFDLLSIARSSFRIRAMAPLSASRSGVEFRSKSLLPPPWKIHRGWTILPSGRGLIHMR